MTWGRRLTFEVSSANPDDAPVWVDLTAYLMHEEGLDLQIGRQDNLDQTQPASLTFTLRNDDHRFTYGNTSSPYTSWWGPGRKCRLRETYGSTVLDLFTGYLQVPQETVPTSPTPSGTGRGQTVSVTAVDRLARLAAAPTFVSTLGAHIVGSVRNDALKGYWPLNDRATPLMPAVGTHSGAKYIPPSTGTPADQYPNFEFNGASSLPGDDVQGLKFLPGLTGSTVIVVPQAYFQTASYDTSIASGQVLTAVIWLNQDVDYSSDNPLDISILTNSTTALFNLNKSSGNWRAHYFDGSFFSVAATSGSTAATSRWYCIAIRWGWTPNVIELWVDDQVYTGTFATVVTSASTNGPYVAVYGSAVHVQLYVGATTDFTSTDFATQRDVGLRGLARQTTGDRIRTIAAYAGIPLAEYNDTVDKGTAVMQAASLADKTPLEAMREAERTEQGLLYVDGSGRLVFKDRRSLYNV